ncbi:hypothetical protein BC830DRAFT_883029 [Chytriomyces sp. MP71]|nr:hypothetical protein BC830DRAFT_883029 [Chytriomyces sp. MP71]
MATWRDMEHLTHLRAQLARHQNECLRLEESINECADIAEIETLNLALMSAEREYNDCLAALQSAEEDSRKHAHSHPAVARGTGSGSGPGSWTPHSIHGVAGLVSNPSRPGTRAHLESQPDVVARHLAAAAKGAMDGAAADWDIFVSYSWRNSLEAFNRGQIDSDAGCGMCDPRDLARRLSNMGHPCWLDADRLEDGAPLYDHLVEAIKPAKFGIVCVSDEYVQSETCKLEFKFLHSRKIPYALVIVGAHKGKEWEDSVVKFLSGDSLYVEATGPASAGLSEETVERVWAVIGKSLPRK